MTPERRQEAWNLVKIPSDYEPEEAPRLLYEALQHIETLEQQQAAIVDAFERHTRGHSSCPLPEKAAELLELVLQTSEQDRERIETLERERDEQWKGTIGVLMPDGRIVMREEDIAALKTRAEQAEALVRRLAQAVDESAAAADRLGEPYQDIAKAMRAASEASKRALQEKQG